VELVELRPGDRLDRGDYVLDAFPVHHGVSSVGYALVETPRPGRFDVDAADARGVPPRDRGKLQRGEAVTAGGRVVAPDEVLGPPRPGRAIVLAGDTAPTRTVLEAAQGADLLVHEATFLEEERERAHETLHSTAAEAAELAREAEVGLLALTHLSSRYFGPEVAREAREIFPETVVPKDFDVIEVPFPERGSPQLVKGGARRERDEAPSMMPAP
jgi:ribonuclease Z